MPPADRINLTGSQRRELKRLIRAGRTEQRMVIRAKIVLAAADGHSNAATARLLAVGEDTVRKWRGRWRNDYVISADEKTSIQARCRCQRSLAPGAARAMRVNHDYDRGGAVAYLAAYDVHRGRVFGRCEDTTGIEPFHRLVEQVMTCEPYASAERVFWIVDNGSSHRGHKAVDRLAAQHPNAIMVHTPVHASWLNQIEIYFSIVQRKALAPNDFTELDEVIYRLNHFEARYNQTAAPFKWKFTTTDLDDLLNRLDNHTPEHDPTQPRAA